MDKITVVCHKDHVVGYEDYAGKCLLCVVEDLMREVGRLTAVCKEKEWVGLTDADKQEAFDETQEASGGFWEFADYLEAKLKEKNA